MSTVRFPGTLRTHSSDFLLFLVLCLVSGLVLKNLNVRDTVHDCSGGGGRPCPWRCWGVFDDELLESKSISINQSKTQFFFSIADVMFVPFSAV